MSNDIIHMNILHIHRSTAGFMCSKRIFTDNHNYNQHVSCEEWVSVTQVLSSIMLIIMLHPTIRSIVKHQHEWSVNVMRVLWKIARELSLTQYAGLYHWFNATVTVSVRKSCRGSNVLQTKCYRFATRNSFLFSSFTVFWVSWSRCLISFKLIILITHVVFYIWFLQQNQIESDTVLCVGL